MEMMESRRVRGVAIVAGIALSAFAFSPHLFSGENISGYLDKRGNAVFINDTVSVHPIPTTTAVSSSGVAAMPSDTAWRFGVRDAMAPRPNLDAVIRYLKYLLGMFNGDLQLSLAVYNTGENALTSNQGVPPYRETRNYLKKIARFYPLDNSPFSDTHNSKREKYFDARGEIQFSNTDSQ
jgi:hypothetical protein